MPRGRQAHPGDSQVPKASRSDLPREKKRLMYESKLQLKSTDRYIGHIGWGSPHNIALDKYLAHAAKYAVFRKIFIHVLRRIEGVQNSVALAVREGCPHVNQDG